MKKINEIGRSMLLMLAILVIIIVLANKALNKFHKYRLFKEATGITMQAKKISCEFDREKYHSYAEMMDKEGLTPAGLQYANDKLSGMEGLTYQFIENANQYFTLQISNLDNRSCTDLVTSQWWGSENTQGFSAMQIEESRWFQIGDEHGARAFCTNHHDGIIKVRFFGCPKDKTK